MPDEKKQSTLADQVRSAQRSMESWPEWMREAARFAGQPREFEKAAARGPAQPDPSKQTKP